MRLALGVRHVDIHALSDHLAISLATKETLSTLMTSSRLCPLWLYLYQYHVPDFFYVVAAGCLTWATQAAKLSVETTAKVFFIGNEKGQPCVAMLAATCSGNWSEVIVEVSEVVC